MKSFLRDIPFGTKILYNNTEAFVIGQSSGKGLILIGWKQKPNNTSYWQDDSNIEMNDTVIETVSQYPYRWWMSSGSEVDILQHTISHPNQRCSSCSISAPHQNPNQSNNSFICEFCCAIKDLA